MVDIAKFVFSIFVVSIHCFPLGQDVRYWGFPLTRIAVPCFFILSGFLFFRNYEPAKMKNLIVKFAKRNLRLYAIWFVLLLPTTIYINRAWLKDGLLCGLKNYLIHFLFGSTFPASWYIVALTIAIIIVCILSTRINNIGLLVIGSIVYLFCYLEGTINWFQLKFYPGDICTSFPFGILFVILGKMLAENIRRNAIWRRSGLISFILFWFMMFETLAYRKQGITEKCYLLMPVFSYLLCQTIVMCKRKFIRARFLRAASTIMYCTHLTVVIVAESFLRSLYGYRNTFPYSTGIFAVTILGGGVLLTLIILKLEELPKLSFLKYAH